MPLRTNPHHTETFVLAFSAMIPVVYSIKLTKESFTELVGQYPGDFLMNLSDDSSSIEIDVYGTYITAASDAEKISFLNQYQEVLAHLRNLGFYIADFYNYPKFTYVMYASSITSVAYDSLAKLDLNMLWYMSEPTARHLNTRLHVSSFEGRFLTFQLDRTAFDPFHISPKYDRFTDTLMSYLNLMPELPID